MKKFLLNAIVFLMVGWLIGEVIARSFYITADIPRRVIDENGIQKYIPLQTGYWLGGGHQWQINEAGWAGPLPESDENLIVLIGDSFIENFMNPDHCHQNVLLQQLMPNYNFFEAARSGVSLVEAFEIANHMSYKQPRLSLIYVHDSDFHESVRQIAIKRDVTQVDLETEEVIPGRIKSAKIKQLLYSSKFAYYLYTRFKSGSKNKPRVKDGPAKSIEQADLSGYNELLRFCADRYSVEDKVLIFRPTSDPRLEQLAQDNGFKTIWLDWSKDPPWIFEHDKHWTGFGHQQAAKQIAPVISDLLYKTTQPEID